MWFPATMKVENPWLHHAATRGFLAYARIVRRKPAKAWGFHATFEGLFEQNAQRAIRSRHIWRRIRRPLLHNAPFGQAAQAHVAPCSTAFPALRDWNFPTRRTRQPFLRAATEISLCGAFDGLLHATRPEFPYAPRSRRRTRPIATAIIAITSAHKNVTPTSPAA